MLWDRIKNKGTTMSKPFRILAACLLAAPLCAQQPEPATLGVQVRGSFPEAGLSDAVGGGAAPGLGVSLVMETDLLEHFEGWRARVALGMDFWFWGNLTKLPGSAGKASAGHISGELVRMLRPGGEPASLGPYLVVGAGLYEWSFTRNDPTLGTVDVKVGHMAGTFGFGWRLTSSLDAEAKVLMGKMDTDKTALAIMAAATWRF
jgi:hypothetical protein